MFAGKTAVVTGTASGIGLACTRALLKQGAKSVVGVDLDEYYTVNHENFTRYRLNVASRPAVDTFYSDFLKPHFDNRAPDLLVNCAGITRDALFLKMTDTEWDSVMNVNLKSLFMMTQNYGLWVKDESIEHGKPQAQRSIVNISSIIGKTGNIGQANYASSKAGVIGFTKSVSKELSRLDIRVNSVLPGFIDTPMTAAVPDRVKRNLVHMIPMQEMGQPDDIADAVIYLGSDQSKYVTGTTLEVTGGFMA